MCIHVSYYACCVGVVSIQNNRECVSGSWLWFQYSLFKYGLYIWSFTVKTIFKTQLHSSVPVEYTVHTYTYPHANMQCEFRKGTYMHTLYSMYMYMYMYYVYLVPASEAGHGVSGGDVFFNVVFQGKVVSPYYCCLQFLVFQVLPFTHTCAVVFKIRHNHYYICKNWSYTSYNSPN